MKNTAASGKIARRKYWYYSKTCIRGCKKCLSCRSCLKTLVNMSFNGKRSTSTLRKKSEISNSEQYQTNVLNIFHLNRYTSQTDVDSMFDSGRDRGQLVDLLSHVVTIIEAKQFVMGLVRKKVYTNCITIMNKTHLVGFTAGLGWFNKFQQDLKTR